MPMDIRKEFTMNTENKQKELRCPMCQELVFQAYSLTKNEKESVNWLHCRCGFMFHQVEVDPKTVWTPEYAKEYADLKFVKERMLYYIRLYAPICEELTYGRRMLDVGFCTPILMEEMERRGWLTAGVDLIPNKYVTGDFMTETFEGERFDLIWMSDFLQCLKDPIPAIYKAYELLRPNGVLFIITPNTDNIRRNYIPAWGHWDMQTCQSFINERILREALIKCEASFNGRMQILYLNPCNMSTRMISWQNMHVIAQKTKVEDNQMYKKLMEDANEGSLETDKGI